MTSSAQQTATATDQPVPDQHLPEHVDVVIIGAGLSGIGAACRLQTQCPGHSYLILEARASLGGTWDLFRYPGIRSDSDMFTLGYPFKPWREATSLADGPAIRSYLEETATEFGVGEQIRFQSRVLAADFDTRLSRWILTVQRPTAEGTEKVTMTCRFLYSCTGYYDYDTPHIPDFAGLESFAGDLVRPQFWPHDLRYNGKRVVVIGSGATAVTLVPSMLEPGEDGQVAAHVTMLQRSPTWIAAVPRRDSVAATVQRFLPPEVAHALIRTKNVMFATAFYQFCRHRPQQARELLLRMVRRQLGDDGLVAEHFEPSYNPWEQRLCAAPSGDLFRAVKAGTAEVVTDTIDSVRPEGLRLASGRVLEADLIVLATGLTMLPLGGVTVCVDGAPVEVAEQYLWRGAMVSGLPNFAICIGYSNASWTLRADLTSRLVCRVLTWMDRHAYSAVVPQPPHELGDLPIVELTSGYVQRGIGRFPRQGDRAPWRMRQNYLLERLTVPRSTMRGLRPFPVRSPVRAGRSPFDR